MQLYIFTRGSVAGPYDESELRDMMEHRETTPDTLACRAGSQEWSPLSTFIRHKPKLRSRSVAEMATTTSIKYSRLNFRLSGAALG